MKALSLWQPWATLMALEKKINETRSWGTDYRGPLAIHAAKQTEEDELMLCNSFYRAALEPLLQRVEDRLPQGVILCVVELVDVVKTDMIRDRISQEEKEFGDYSTGRFAWITKLVHVFETPIPWRGEQGLWNCDCPVLREFEVMSR